MHAIGRSVVSCPLLVCEVSVGGGMYVDAKGVRHPIIHVQRHPGGTATGRARRPLSRCRSAEANSLPLSFTPG